METVHILTGSGILPDEAEALRYLGFGSAAPDGQTLALLHSCREELAKALTPRCCSLRVPLSIEGSRCDLGCMVLESAALAAHLRGCGEAILMAATIGAEADRLIRRAAALSPASAAVLDALASSAIEVWCDRAEAELTAGAPHTSRFSPGYGDLPLTAQRSFERCLQLNRIGLTLTDTLLMVPTKSVTAVIGLGRSGTACSHKCAACTLTGCAYRRDIL